MIEYIVLLFAIPLGILCAKVTRDEKKIYLRRQYFPSMIWIVAILAAVFLSLDKVVGFSLVFITLMIGFWMRGSET
jgi:hypothetical protein